MPLPSCSTTLPWLLSNMARSSDRWDLNERERAILRAIVHLYILHAAPVGSRVLSRYLEREFSLSPATIRNVMADLEERGFITHPHTSAGRMPTDAGYRCYVDTMMQAESLSGEETRTVVENLRAVPKDAVLREASKLLGTLSHHVAIVQMPHLRDARIQRVEMFALSSQRLLVVIALESDIVRTMSIETTHEIQTERIDAVCRSINERICGKPLHTIGDLVLDVAAHAADADRTLVRLFVHHVDALQSRSVHTADGIHVAGTQHLLTLPEFGHPERMRSVIELVENHEVIVHLLDATPTTNDGVRVHIGSELPDASLEDYSLIASTYRVGAAHGTVGVIGPKRMNYSRMVSLVDFVSVVLSSSFDASSAS